MDKKQNSDFPPGNIIVNKKIWENVLKIFIYVNVHFECKFLKLINIYFMGNHFIGKFTLRKKFIN